MTLDIKYHSHSRPAEVEAVKNIAEMEGIHIGSCKEDDKYVLRDTRGHPDVLVFKNNEVIAHGVYDFSNWLMLEGLLRC